MKSLSHFFSAVVATWCIVASNTAHADLIVQSFVNQHVGTLLGPATVTSPNGQTTLNGNFTLTQAVNQFDPSLGTLNGVNIFFEVDFAMTGTGGPSGGSLSGSASASYRWGGSSYFGGGTGSGTGGGPSSPLNASFSMGASNNLTSPSLLNSAIGTGTVDWEFVASSAQVSINGSGTSGQLDVSGDELTVTYDFTPTAVPEASVATVWSLVAVGVAIKRRRKCSDEE